MIITDEVILVTGATGRQGGATVTRLLSAGASVRALVRDPDRPAARSLAAAGAELRVGDLDDIDSLTSAAAGAYGVFGVTPDDEDVEREVRGGRNLADAAAAAGVSHLVFASVGGAERWTGIAEWTSKWRIEQHIRDLDLPATVLRPVRFMENHAIRGLPLGGIVNGELTHLFGPDVPVQLIAAADIGAFAVLAFTRPHEYIGVALEIAGDELTPRRTVDLMSYALGREITYRQISVATLGLGDDAERAFTSERGLWQADIPYLRERHPALLDFPTWLTQGGAAQIEALFTD
jgi:uncharacterized protein YbjT (DUF2867 family)